LERSKRAESKCLEQEEHLGSVVSKKRQVELALFEEIKQLRNDNEASRVEN
jgi:hypothetical protein